MAKILLVDDEALVVDTLSSALESKGHTIVTAANGLEGLKRFAEGGFDLVITDIIMPDKEGIGMIMEMRSVMPAAKIIAISGGGRTGNVEVLKMAGELGAMTTVKKPIRLAELISVVDGCLAQHGDTKAVQTSSLKDRM
jgi:YesN/AraC family two-component response regulator